MSIVNKNNTNNSSSPVTQNNREEYILIQQEIEYLLELIKNSMFKGEQLETVYNIVYKLQQQYLSQK
jgi:hypothetical protein